MSSLCDIFRACGKFLVLLVLQAFMTVLQVCAVDWNTVINSTDVYYHGLGYGATEEEASKSALEELVSSIALYVQSDFEKIYVDKETDKGDEFTEVVRNCLQTFSAAFLPNVTTFPPQRSKAGYTVLKFIRKSELDTIYKGRTNRLKGMVKMADNALDRGDVSVALQYYYWAYSLLRSLQHPSSVTDDNGRILVDALPAAIRNILDNIDVEFVSREGDWIDLFFTYKGNPTSVDFTYYDGRKDNCVGIAEGGNACIEMAPGYAETGAYHINIEYEYKSDARGEFEVGSVLGIISKANFGREIIVRDPSLNIKAIKAPDVAALTDSVPRVSVMESLASVQPVKVALQQTEVKIAEASENSFPKAELPLYAEVMDTVMQALATRQYDMAAPCFIGRGLENYTRLVTRRRGKLIGQPNPRLYVNARGNVMARGVQLSFSVTERGQKTTFTDDVIFTFDENRKISNLTFGIGSIAEDQLLKKEADWSEEVRQQVLDFLENYKTAYCLKDSDYIDAVFSDNATIIVGNVAKVTAQPGVNTSEMSQQGRDIITYKKYTKTEYLDNLKKTFRRNHFINIKFTDNDVQVFEQDNGDRIVAIQLAQQYNSSTYADFGYLFLKVDMTHPDEPVIEIRTWQPQPDDDLGRYGIGHFYE